MYFKHKIKLYVVFCIFKLNYRESVLFLSDQNQIEICSEFADEILDSTEYWVISKHQARPWPIIEISSTNLT